MKKKPSYEDNIYTAKNVGAAAAGPDFGQYCSNLLMSPNNQSLR